MRVTAIVLAAGKGSRFGSKIPKLLFKIAHRPLITYSLSALSAHPLINDIILVVNEKSKDKILNCVRKYRIDKVRMVVMGGKRRQDSVYNGIKAMDSRTDLVLIHDGARPFIDKKMISSAIRLAEKNQAVIVGVPVKATIKKVARRIVEKTIDRSNLWEIQTPQVFNKNLISKAYKKFSKADVTDDAMLVEKIGAKVSVVLGTYNNIKITTPEDLIIAQAIARSV